MKTYGGMDVWVMFSWPRHYLEVSCQIHVPTALPGGGGEEPPVPIG
jgi:hypothetical protein